MELVGGVEAVEVAVEGVRVLHDELARAQQAGARARLVALLGLEVVEQLRQVAVGAHLARDVEREVLLVRHREDQFGAAAVLQLEDLVDVVAAGLLPQLGGLEHGHQHLPRADRIHLLAHDLLGPAVGPPAGREEGPEPGARPAGRGRRGRSACARSPPRRRAPPSWLAGSSGKAGSRAGESIQLALMFRPPQSRSRATARGTPFMDVSPRLRAGLRAFGALTGLALLAYVSHTAFGLGSPELDGFFQDWVYCGLVIAAGAACVARAVAVRGGASGLARDGRSASWRGPPARSRGRSLLRRATRSPPSPSAGRRALPRPSIPPATRRCSCWRARAPTRSAAASGSTGRSPRSPWRR